MNARLASTVRAASLAAVPLAALLANLFFSFFGAGDTLSPSVLRDLRFIFTHPSLSYDDKMALKYPDDYPRMKFIVEHTGPDAAVLVPNVYYHGALTSYLMYPRTADGHREEFLWGKTPVGTYAFVEDWPTGASEEVGRASRVVATRDRFAIIVRVEDSVQK